MRRLIAAMAVVCLWAADAAAYNCEIGGEQISVQSSLNILWEPTPSMNGIIWVGAWTRRSNLDAQECPGWVRIEGWIIGSPDGAVVKQNEVNADIGSVSVIELAMFVGPVSQWYSAYTKHSFIHDGWIGDPWVHIVDMQPSVYVNAQPDPPDPAYECMLQGGSWDGNMCQLPNCPLIVDTAHDGYRLTSVDNGVRFDLDADGTPEQVAWTREGSDDAFLVLDRNGNGTIDNGTELFGNKTPAYADTPQPTASNGFEALKFAEGRSWGTSVPDTVIDNRDAVFGQLALWRDLNHNGISEPHELQPIGQSDLLAIRTDWRASRRIDRHGNEFRQRAKGIFGAGEFWIYDVWFNWRP